MSLGNIVADAIFPRIYGRSVSTRLTNGSYPEILPVANTWPKILYWEVS